MRKKSHICLAYYLINTVDNQMLDEHKKAFAVGSILPDCKPSFVTKRHTFDETFDMVKGYIDRCSKEAFSFEDIKTAYYTRLGEITHYIADYFTFPHNKHFDGSLSEHCIYEKYLKHGLKSYVKSNECEMFYPSKKIESVRELCEFIEEKHKEYMQEKSTVERDCRYIVAMCTVVVKTILELIVKAVSDFTSMAAIA